MASQFFDELNRDFRPYLKDPFQFHKLKEILSQVNGPLDCEIGCGVGWHPIQYATKHPLRHILAIEHTAEKYRRFEKRLKNSNLGNLYPCHGNALSVIPAVLPKDSVDRFLILYPNPNPKTKHANLRWHRMPFMACMIERLRAGGMLQLATNERWYFEEARLYWAQMWGLEIVEEQSISLSTHPQWMMRTHFEKKYLERGQIIYNLTVRKRPLKVQPLESSSA